VRSYRDRRCSSHRSDDREKEQLEKSGEQRE
jgi:hypothetical protein